MKTSCCFFASSIRALVDNLIEQVKAMTAEKCDVEESMKANNILCLMM